MKKPWNVILWIVHSLCGDFLVLEKGPFRTEVTSNFLQKIAYEWLKFDKISQILPKLIKNANIRCRPSQKLLKWALEAFLVEKTEYSDFGENVAFSNFRILLREEPELISVVPRTSFWRLPDGYIHLWALRGTNYYFCRFLVKNDTFCGTFSEACIKSELWGND